MNKLKKRKIYFGLFWFFLTISFICFATFLIFTANGYHLNTITLKLEKTGMVVVNGKISNIKAVLNNNEKIVNLPTRFTRLFPGPYTLSLQKDGYHGFQKSFQLAGGQAVVIDNLTLFLLNAKVISLNNDSQTLTQITRANSSQIGQFIVVNNEIWQNNKLVTRFSQPVIAAIFDLNTNHYYVQLPDGIHAILSDGSNDVLLVKLDQTTPITMSINNNNLSYILDDEAFQTQLW